MKEGKYIRTKEHRERMSKSIKMGFANGRIHPMLGKKRGRTPEAVKDKIRKSNSGKDCYLWKGGISYELYTTGWTKKFRETIRKRDYYICRICGKKQEDKTFCVHHIDYNKKNLSLNNLITLCPKCHPKTNQNRDQWYRLLMLC